MDQGNRVQQGHELGDIVTASAGQRHRKEPSAPVVAVVAAVGEESPAIGDVTCPPGLGCGKYRLLLRARGITPKIAPEGTAHGSGLDETRWVVEGAVSSVRIRRSRSF